MRRAMLGLLAAAVCLPFTGEARAQDDALSWEQLRKLPKPQRQALTLAYCRKAVNEASPTAPGWCARAWREASGATGPDKAEALMLRRWTLLVDARPRRPWSPSERGIQHAADPRLAEARHIAFDTVGYLGPQTWRDDFHERLARIVGVELSGRSMMEQRLVLLRAAAKTPNDEASLWVIVALATNWRLEYTDLLAEMTRESAEAHRRDLVAILTQVLPESRQATGMGRATYPLIATALVGVLRSSADHEAIEPVARDAIPACDERLWSRSVTCLELRFAVAMGREQGRVLADNPDRLRLRPPLPRLARGALVQDALYEGRPCRGVVRFDLSPEGIPVNVRVPFAEPAGECGDLVRRTSGRLLYEPLSAQPDAIRTDLLQPVIVTPQD